MFAIRDKETGEYLADSLLSVKLFATPVDAGRYISDRRMNKKIFEIVHVEVVKKDRSIKEKDMPWFLR